MPLVVTCFQHVGPTYLSMPPAREQVCTYVSPWETLHTQTLVSHSDDNVHAFLGGREPSHPHVTSVQGLFWHEGGTTSKFCKCWSTQPQEVVGESQNEIGKFSWDTENHRITGRSSVLDWKCGPRQASPENSLDLKSRSKVRRYTFYPALQSTVMHRVFWNPLQNLLFQWIPKF